MDEGIIRERLEELFFCYRDVILDYSYPQDAEQLLDVLEEPLLDVGLDIGKEVDISLLRKIISEAPPLPLSDLLDLIVESFIYSLTPYEGRN